MRYNTLNPSFPCSSAVESSAVNRFVASSNLAGGVGRSGNVRIFQKQESAGQTLEVFSTAICGLLRTGEIRFGTFFINKSSV